MVSIYVETDCATVVWRAGIYSASAAAGRRTAKGMRNHSGTGVGASRAVHTSTHLSGSIHDLRQYSSGTSSPVLV